MASTTSTNTGSEQKYIYGSGADLANAIKNYGDNSNYKFVDTSQAGFDPNSMVSGSYMLGGTGVNKNVTNDLLSSKGISRLAGKNASGTATSLANTLGTKFIYGSGNDLNNARSLYGNNPNYKLVDVSADDFNPGTMVAGSIMLGGSGVNTDITDGLLNSSGVTRLAGKNSEDTADKLNQYHVNSLMPSNEKFSFSGNLQDYLDQAQNLLAPQLELTKQNINDNFDTNYIPAANNDSLSRGLSRTSYAGNRVDQLNESRDKELSQAVIQNLQNANNLALQNYNTAYDRSFNEYNSNFNNNMALYSASDNNYWQNKNYNSDQAYKDQQQNNWQQTFDFNKTNADREYELEKQKLEASLAAAASGGGSGGRSGGSSGRSSGSSKSSSGSSSLDKQVYANFNASSVQDQYGMLHDPDVINNISSSMYKTLQSQYSKNLKDSGLSDSLVKASQPTWNYEDSNAYIYSGGR